MPRAGCSAAGMNSQESRPLTERDIAPRGHSIIQMAKMGGINHSLSKSVRERVEMDCLVHMLNF